MKHTSKTGLTASPIKKLPLAKRKTDTLQLKAIAKPAPFILKPYSALYNPYSGGCSLLCNHPIDKETKELFRKAKENWTTRPRVLLADEVKAIQAGLTQYSFREKSPRYNILSHIECVPNELFKRYSETDSRPFTPAPTLASGATRASGSRRCVTPEEIRPKARLVLDLRRTHSQETLSYSVSITNEPPLIRIQRVPTRTASLEELPHIGPPSSRHSLPVHTPRKSKTASSNTKINLTVIKTEKVEVDVEEDQKSVNTNEEEDEEGYIKRRGKKKKKKTRDPSRGPPAYQVSLDPETQVATIGPDSTNHSARASLVPGNTSQDAVENGAITSSANKNTYLSSQKSLDVDSYLDKEILKQLRRELNEEVVDTELNLKRRKALEEALKAVSKDKTDCEELVNLQKELKLAPLNTDLWISLPRTFTRSSARFELPLDGGSLSKMTPVDYARDHVSISSGRKLLFNCIFNKFKMEAELENEHERKLSSQALQEALNLLMGRPMKKEESDYFRSLVGWKDSDVFDFRTFCGMAALCERLMAPFYCPRLPDRKADPCHEIESADFKLLTKKINGHCIDERLKQILNSIKTL